VTEPSNSLDEVVHQRTRLGILTITNEAQRVEFGFLQETLELTAGNLSKHLQVLEVAGLVGIEKGYEARRPKTWVSITRRGVKALQSEIGALKQIVARVEKPGRASAVSRNRTLRLATDP
jgi:DNA-binding MarR family transcriptional regulator